jgi:hypothetical protein
MSVATLLRCLHVRISLCCGMRAMKFIIRVFYDNKGGKPIVPTQNYNKDSLYEALETYHHFAASNKVSKVELLLVLMEGHHENQHNSTRR